MAVRTLLYEAANVMLTRYKGQLKLKDWAFAIAKRLTMRKARVALARRLAIIMYAMLWYEPESRRLRPINPLEQETASSSQEKRRLREEQTTARILLHGPTVGRLRFQPSRPAPSLPHQAPNERGENTGTRKRRDPEETPALDPLENNIRL